LAAAKAALDQKRAENNPVAAIIVEPTNSTTGVAASHTFIQQLKSLARDYDAALIVDETNSGCGASGQGFWQYSGPADFVVFGKRTQVSGFFSKECPEHNFHLGDSELKLRQFAVIHDVIQS
jgi:4-aminobutyrate aminotransferase/(S)-3-amino-2-methylpropionate transaminase